MKLSISQIKAVTLGAVRIEEKKDGIHFYRFTEQQEELYKKRRDDFYIKTFSASGVKIRFRTNSQSLFFKADVAKGSSRTYFSFDVFINGELSDSLNNYSDVKLLRDYTKTVYPLGEFSKRFDLGAGEKEICVYFPWSVCVVLKEFELDDGCFFEAVKPAKKLICFGDSISQGYDALNPANKYTTQLAKMLDAEEFNKAIGGEIFFPELAATKESFEPDYITVAYGTNDWYLCSMEEFTQNCEAFFCNLNKSYPRSKIIVITPIWRKDLNEPRQFGDFKKIEEIIKNQVCRYEQMSTVCGFEFVPFIEDLFADLRLHPNDSGFTYYYNNLVKEIKKL